MASTTAKRHRMRCSRGKHGCGSRFTLKRHPLDYKRDPKCPHCGSIHVLSVEKYRRAELKRQRTCRCNAYPFPHRAGSLRMCVEHPLANEDPTDEEIYYYESCLATPRSAFI